ncbi:MAG: dockerin type I repeat-containing protein [Clostridia bacterium]|nr:dockerin type I repeat-containing protein [Clostridia bacterium]
MKKKILTILLVVCVLFTCTVSVNAFPQRAGDVNQDGQINTGDAAEVLRVCVGTYEFESGDGLEHHMATMDANADGVVNTGDAVHILYTLAYSESEDKPAMYARYYLQDPQRGNENWVANDWYESYILNNEPVYDGGSVMYVAESVDDLEAFCVSDDARVGNMFADELSTLSVSTPEEKTYDIRTRFDDKFFENDNCVVFIYVSASTDPRDVDVPCVRVQDGKVTVNIDLLYNQISIPITGELIIAVGMEKLPEGTEIIPSISHRVVVS